MEAVNGVGGTVREDIQVQDRRAAHAEGEGMIVLETA